MESFALWCEPRDDSELSSIRVLMNFNLWLESEKSSQMQPSLDVGIMLLPGKKSAQQEAKDSAQQNIGNIVDSIFFYCPFSVEQKDFNDLFEKMNQETIGAIFNDMCECTEASEHTAKRINLSKGDPCENFLLCKCNYEIQDGKTIKIKIDKEDINQALNAFNKGIGNELMPIYYRFRLTGKPISNVITESHSKDQLLTSAFSKEEIVDFRFNDYRTLGDETVKRNINNKDKKCVPIENTSIHFLLMSSANVDVDSGNGAERKRRLLEKTIWEKYAPIKQFDEVVAWHWKSELKEESSNGYTMYLRLKRHVSNWKTIIIYLLVGLCINVFYNWVYDLPKGVVAAGLTLVVHNILHLS